MLKYALYDNGLTSDPDDYRASAQQEKSKDLDYIINKMIGRGSTITKAEALSAIEEYYAALEEALQEGHSINTPMYNVAHSIKGVFNDKDETFDRSKHSIKLKFNPGTRLRTIIDKIEVEKIKATKRLPVVDEFIDTMSNTTDELLTPGGGAQVKGALLQIDEQDPQQGVFFIAANGTATQVAHYMRNKPSELIFMIPASLKKGSYRLEVRNILRNTKNLRVGSFPIELAVQ